MTTFKKETCLLMSIAQMPVFHSTDWNIESASDKFIASALFKIILGLFAQLIVLIIGSSPIVIMTLIQLKPLFNAWKTKAQTICYGLSSHIGTKASQSNLLVLASVKTLLTHIKTKARELSGRPQAWERNHAQSFIQRD